MTMHWSIIFIGSILVILGIALPGTSQEEIESFADRLYCKIGGPCNITNLEVINLTVKGDYLNVSVTNFNVTGDINLTGCIDFTGGLFLCGNTNTLGNLTINEDICLGGVCVDSWADVNQTGGDPDTKWALDNVYLHNVSDVLTFNESLMNLTIEALASGGIWTNVSGTATYPDNVSILGNLTVDGFGLYSGTFDKTRSYNTGNARLGSYYDSGGYWGTLCFETDLTGVGGGNSVWCMDNGGEDIRFYDPVSDEVSMRIFNDSVDIGDSTHSRDLNVTGTVHLSNGWKIETNSARLRICQNC